MLQKDIQQFIIPPKIKFQYTDFELAAETTSYRVFEAKLRNTRQKHMIRIFDSTKDLSDIEFLRKDIYVGKLKLLDPEDICYLQGKGSFFLSNWTKFLANEAEPVGEKSSILEGTNKEQLTSQDLALEIRRLALVSLKLKGVACKEFEILLEKDPSVKIYEAVVKITLEENFAHCKKLRNLIEKMLNLDPLGLPTLEEFKLFVKEDKIQNLR